MANIELKLQKTPEITFPLKSHVIDVGGPVTLFVAVSIVNNCKAPGQTTEQLHSTPQTFSA